MENNNNLRPLGRSGIMVTPIGLGCWQFSKQNNLAGKFWPRWKTTLSTKWCPFRWKVASTGSTPPKLMAMELQKWLYRGLAGSRKKAG